VIDELGYDQPTPIQVEAIPLLLAGKDLVGHSKTGSGKTAAFALPILQNIVLATRTLQALVVCPTRELCAQVAREIRTLGRKHDGLVVLTVSGGEPIRTQVNALDRGVHVAVGTPGRLLDHLGRGTVNMEAITTLVLDEADRMLDMGFQADVEKILGALPTSRQTAFFSATFPGSIEAMSRAYQRDAVKVTIGAPEQATPEIRQLSLAVDTNTKHDALHWILGEYPHDSALVFCNLKATVTELTRALTSSDISVDCLHGDLDQFHRDQVLAKFRNQSVRVLVATDVAGRGIDVEDLDLVINYEMPEQAKIYLHRIGRTGRAGKLGIAVSLVTSRDRRRLAAIEDLAGSRMERLARLPVGETETKAPPRSARMNTIMISGGRKDKLRPGDILGALTGEAVGLDAADVGKIEIHDRYSYVAVSKRSSRAAAKGLSLGRIKRKRFRVTLV